MIVAMVAVSPRERVAKWQRSYATCLILTDLIVVVTASFGAQYWRFGTSLKELAAYPTGSHVINSDYSVVSVVLVLLWMGMLQLLDTRDYRVVGTGPEEYRRVFDATLGAFGAAAIIAFLFKLPIARGYLIIAGPIGLFLLLVTRWFCRKWLHKNRQHGAYSHRALVVGQPDKVDHIVESIRRDPNAGYLIVDTFPINGEADSVGENGAHWCSSRILTALDEVDADTIVLAGSDALTPHRLRELSWEMEDREVEMVVAPTLTDVAGPRIHMRPVAGLPLIHVDFPRLTKKSSFIKRSFDIVSSAILIVIGSPILALVAIAVKVSSPGPVLFRQERIGLNGEPFTMLKFRSMVVDADSKLADLLKDQKTDDKPLFKVRNDPRITQVGRFLRKYSLDELPQLFNVLFGSMSLVGPRPQVAAEVALYDESVHRRLLTRPGITGLWQVSGRSDLDWDDAIRLDLYYVENWSFMSDVVIAFKTLRVVFIGTGAY